MKFKIYHVLLAFFLLMSLSESCKKDKSATYDVYCSGRYKNSNNINAACYWKNGTFVALGLNDDLENSTATDILVSGDNVYAVGYKFSTNYNMSRPCIWVNGKLLYLFPPNVVKGTAEGISISNGEIYIVGEVGLNNNPFCITYALNNPVFVDNLTGYTKDMDFDNEGNTYVGGVRGEYSGYWKNGEPFTNIIKSSYVSGIAVQGTDIYMGADNTASAEAGYLKNTDFVSLGSANTTSVNNIGMMSGKLYVVGNITDQNVTKATLWLNDAPVALSELESSAYRIAFKDSRVFIAGENSGMACYWKDNSLFSLNTPNSAALSVYLYPED
ncbi:MAG: hypothetical protein ACKOW2_00525 [Sphingobacteriaceae bacterium]